MNKYYEMKIGNVTRALPICRVTDDLYIGAFVIIGDQELTVEAAKELLEIAPEYDYIITAEAKGIPLAHEMARQRGDKTYFCARKHAKAYMKDAFEVKVRSITTNFEQSLFIDSSEAEMIRGKRILLVDDVISTGESIAAVETLVKEAGGNIAGIMTILAEGDAQNREDIIYLEKLPLFNKDGEIIG